MATIQNQKNQDLRINPESGLAEGIDFIASPNEDARPDETDISLIVIHSISLPPGEYGGGWIEQLFTNRLPANAHPYFEEIHQLEVSAHVLISRDGHLQQFVPFHRRAWHAGQSNYQGREQVNDFSIGIELEGTDTDLFEDAQYQALAQLILELERSYPQIDRQRLAGHSDIAPGRKTDPGTGFDWAKLDQNLSE